MLKSQTGNVDPDVVEGFGHEWSTFRQDETALAPEERERLYRAYFGIFPWEALPNGGGTGVDVGCGSGRWSALVAPRVKHLHLLDASREALEVARKNLSGRQNVSFHLSSVETMPLAPGSLDFAFSLGVLHHVLDTAAAIASVAKVLKPGAPFLIYLYYAFDNRPGWYRAIWRASNSLRVVISRMPLGLRYASSQFIAATVYWPLARMAHALERLGFASSSLPLSFYRDKSFYVMRTDAYDRFCTRLEQRFTRAQIESMLVAAGFERVSFSDTEPYWVGVAYRAST
jgi:ubiquinone/menaquinone biosynthesis C-methylase UbiE